jgi:glycosyltransferase involved in cell wall biosynthesis
VKRESPARRKGERSRLVRLLAAHARLALRLRASRGPRREARKAGAPLRVALCSAYPPGHYGTVVRLAGWIPHLKARGCEPELLCPSTDEEFAEFGRGDLDADYRYHRAVLGNLRSNLRRAAEADVVVLHRGVLPFSPWQRPTFERILARWNPRIVYDFYDSIWEQRRIVHDRAGGRLARWLNPRDLVERIACLARTVTVATDYLAEFAHEVHGDVRVYPMMLDPEAYPVKESRESEKPVLGWLGGRGNLSRLESVTGALRAAANAAPFRLKVVSSETFEAPGLEVESAVHPFSPESEKEDLLSFDIGLLPLRDDAEDRGKFPLKLIQYAAAGLPIVATPVAIDRRAFRDGESILFAGSEREWTEAVARLAGDAGLRAKLGAAARRVVEERYSFAAWTHRYRSMLARVARDPAPESAV